MEEETIFPRVDIGVWAESAMDWLTTHGSRLFDTVETATAWLVDSLDSVLLAPSPIVVIIIVTALAWLIRSWPFAIATALGFALVVSMDQWENAMLTLSLVLIAASAAVVIAVPIGIAAARSNAVSTSVRPLLDFMQTMPAFVYLIPAIIFFGVGAVPGIFATVIFSLPPGVRFTELGIRQVDSETVEAGAAFGATPRQILRGIQLPLATPTIMAGVNQVIMLALSMVVIAGMVGADGLGKAVVAAISSQNIPQGVEAGLGVVVLAIFLDRMTAALGNPGDYPSSLYRLIRKGVKRS